MTLQTFAINNCWMNTNSWTASSHIKSLPLDTLLASQANLISRRQSFLRSVSNMTTRASFNYEERMDSLLAEYEAVVDDAIKNNVDPVSQSFNPNWDYIQAVFFSTTILTTIGLTTTESFAVKLYFLRLRQHCAKNIQRTIVLHPFCHRGHSLHPLSHRWCWSIVCNSCEYLHSCRKRLQLFVLLKVMKGWCSRIWYICSGEPFVGSLWKNHPTSPTQVQDPQIRVRDTAAIKYLQQPSHTVTITSIL